MQEARKDGWRAEEDQLLTEIVLKHIREKSTQLNAFKEAALALGRSESACGFRWNSQLRKTYFKEIEIAKIERNQKIDPVDEPKLKVSTAASVEISDEQESEYAPDFTDQIIQLAEKQKQLISNMANQIKYLNEQLNEKNNEIEQLKQNAVQIVTEESLKEDFEKVIQIFQRVKHFA